MNDERRDGLEPEELEEIRRVPADGRRELRSRRRGARRRGGVPAFLLVIALLAGAAGGLSGGYYLWGQESAPTVDLSSLKAPSYVDQQFLRKNIFSRPDVSRPQVTNIVIHYVANPGSSAQQNRNYFDSLADQDPSSQGTSAGCHFIVGLEGEIIQCIPVSEIAYANAPRNLDTVAIEVCHPDETGRFNDATYESLVKLTAWLCGELKLDEGDVIRHYDVNGKNCPKYYVEHEDAWKQLREDVGKAIRGEARTADADGAQKGGSSQKESAAEIVPERMEGDDGAEGGHSVA